MKKGLLGSTALIGATVLMAGVAGAAEAPTYKLSGAMNFQVYNVEQDALAGLQDHGWYFGVDSAEIHVNVSGTADNGLGYGFKVELDALNGGADEAVIKLSGGWGAVEMGIEDGAEDRLNVGGESLMGATGGFDGDWGDAAYVNITDAGALGVAPSGPTIAGDTGDANKITYFSPSFSGFKVGASITPQDETGGTGGVDTGTWENNIGLGAQYDNSFGNVSVQASAVYAMASSTNAGLEDIGAWSVGGVVGFGPFSVGAAYADNGESGEIVGSGTESSYWNAAASFSSGPMAFAIGYFASTVSYLGVTDGDFTDLALTADYTVAPGLGVYGEVNLLTSEVGAASNDGTVIIVGANVSF